MSKPVLSSLDFANAARIINLPDGVGGQEPATVAQLNAAVEGLAWKDSCRVATQSNVSVASPGATVDGISMVAGDRVLFRAQTAASENGIYIWNGAAVAATRALDANTANELEQAITTVEEGTSAGATFRQTLVNFTLGIGSVAWTSFGTSSSAATTGAAGIVRLATQGEVDTGTDATIAVTPATFSGSSLRMKKFAASFGDGSATQYDLAHNLNSLDCQVEVVRVSDGVTVLCDVTRTTVNNVRLNFAVAPTANQYRVIVIS